MLNIKSISLLYSLFETNKLTKMIIKHNRALITYIIELKTSIYPNKSMT